MTNLHRQYYTKMTLNKRLLSESKQSVMMNFQVKCIYKNRRILKMKANLYRNNNQLQIFLVLLKIISDLILIKIKSVSQESRDRTQKCQI